MILEKLLPAIPVDRLRGRVVTAEADLQKAKDAFADAAYAAEETPGNAADKRREAAHRDMLEAEKWLASVRAALQRAVAKDAQRQQEESRAAIAAKWDEVEEAASERLKAASDVAKAANALVEAQGRLHKYSEAMHVQGVIRDAEDSLLFANDIDRWFRAHLVKAGMPFALNWPWGRDELPDIQDKFKEANARALSGRPSP